MVRARTFIADEREREISSGLAEGRLRVSCGRLSISCARGGIAPAIGPLEKGVANHAHDLASLEPLLIEIEVKGFLLGLLAGEANLEGVGQIGGAVDDAGALEDGAPDLGNSVRDAVLAVRAELMSERALREPSEHRRVEGFPGERGQITKLIEILRELPCDGGLAGRASDIHRDGVGWHGRGDRPLNEPSRVFGEFGRVHFHGERR